MRYQINAASLTRPTFETLQEQINLRFKKIEKMLSRFKSGNAVFKVSVTKEGKEFVLVVELNLEEKGKNLVVKEKGYDLRAIIAEASKKLKFEITKLRDRKTDYSDKINIGEFLASGLENI